MPSLTIKNLPDGLYDRLKETAARQRRSLNSEVIHRLEASLGAAPLEVEELMSRARAVRERASLPYLTDEMLRAARDADYTPRGAKNEHLGRTRSDPSPKRVRAQAMSGARPGPSPHSRGSRHHRLD